MLTLLRLDNSIDIVQLEAANFFGLPNPNSPTRVQVNFLKGRYSVLNGMRVTPCGEAFIYGSNIIDSGIQPSVRSYGAILFKGNVGDYFDLTPKIPSIETDKILYPLDDVKVPRETIWNEVSSLQLLCDSITVFARDSCTSSCTLILSGSFEVNSNKMKYLAWYNRASKEWSQPVVAKEALLYFFDIGHSFIYVTKAKPTTVKITAKDSKDLESLTIKNTYENTKTGFLKIDINYLNGQTLLFGSFALGGCSDLCYIDATGSIINIPKTTAFTKGVDRIDFDYENNNAYILDNKLIYEFNSAAGTINKVFEGTNTLAILFCSPYEFGCEKGSLSYFNSSASYRGAILYGINENFYKRVMTYPNKDDDYAVGTRFEVFLEGSTTSKQQTTCYFDNGITNASVPITLSGSQSFCVSPILVTKGSFNRIETNIYNRNAYSAGSRTLKVVRFFDRFSNLVVYKKLIDSWKDSLFLSDTQVVLRGVISLICIALIIAIITIILRLLATKVKPVGRMLVALDLRGDTEIIDKKVVVKQKTSIIPGLVTMGLIFVVLCVVLFNLYTWYTKIQIRSFEKLSNYKDVHPFHLSVRTRVEKFTNDSFFIDAQPGQQIPTKVIRKFNDFTIYIAIQKYLGQREFSEVNQFTQTPVQEQFRAFANEFGHPPFIFPDIYNDLSHITIYTTWSTFKNTQREDASAVWLSEAWERLFERLNILNTGSIPVPDKTLKEDKYLIPIGFGFPEAVRDPNSITINFVVQPTIREITYVVDSIIFVIINTFGTIGGLSVFYEAVCVFLLLIHKYVPFLGFIIISFFVSFGIVAFGVARAYDDFIIWVELTTGRIQFDWFHWLSLGWFVLVFLIRFAEITIFNLMFYFKNLKRKISTPYRKSVFILYILRYGLCFTDIIYPLAVFAMIIDPFSVFMLAYLSNIQGKGKTGKKCRKIRRAFLWFHKGMYWEKIRELMNKKKRSNSLLPVSSNELKTQDCYNIVLYGNSEQARKGFVSTCNMALGTKLGETVFLDLKQSEIFCRLSNYNINFIICDSSTVDKKIEKTHGYLFFLGGKTTAKELKGLRNKIYQKVEKTRIPINIVRGEEKKEDSTNSEEKIEIVNVPEDNADSIAIGARIFNLESAEDAIINLLTKIDKFTEENGKIIK